MDEGKFRRLLCPEKLIWLLLFALLAERLVLFQQFGVRYMSNSDDVAYLESGLLFAKTGMIEPGQSEVVTITFDQEDMASYDEKGAGCYVLEQGDYIISVNADSHTILDQRTFTLGSTITYNESNPRQSDKVAAVNQLQDAQGDVVFHS